MLFTASYLPATGITLGHTARDASTSPHVSVSSPGRLSQGPIARRRSRRPRGRSYGGPSHVGLLEGRDEALRYSWRVQDTGKMQVVEDKSSWVLDAAKTLAAGRDLEYFRMQIERIPVCRGHSHQYRAAFTWRDPRGRPTCRTTETATSSRSNASCLTSTTRCATVTAAQWCHGY